MRTTTPASASPSARAGSVSVRRIPTRPPLYPETGNHPSFRPKISASIKPSQKPGSANANVVPNRIELSSQLLGRSAAMIANGTPIRSESSMP